MTRVTSIRVPVRNFDRYKAAALEAIKQPSNITAPRMKFGEPTRVLPIRVSNRQEYDAAKQAVWKLFCEIYQPDNQAVRK
jgi:hypothetical protein